MPRTWRLPRLSPIRVVFGAIVSVADLASKGYGETRQERICTALRDNIAGLGHVRRGGRGDSSSSAEN